MDQVRENDQEFTVEFVFELLFKAIAALLLCVVATIPMTIIKELVESLLRMFVSPLSNILIFLFEFVLGILFLILCGFIFIAMFKQYVTPNKKKEVKKEEIKKETKSEEKETKKENLVKSSGPDALGTLIITIMKIAVIFFILLPIWMMEFGIGICLVFLIAALIKGIFFIGPLFLCAGGICLLSEISSIIYRMIFTEKKPHFYGIIIGLVFLVIGTFLTIDLVMNFDYIKDVPSGYHQKTYTEIPGIDVQEIKPYIESKLKAAGLSVPLFTEDAITALGSCAQGSMRKLNNLLTQCLIIGANKNVRDISNEIVMMATNEVELN